MSTRTATMTSNIRRTIFSSIQLNTDYWLLVTGLEQCVLFASRLDVEVFISQMSCHPSAGRAIQEADLDQERLIDFFDGIRFLRKRGGKSVHAHRSTLI